MANNPYVNKVVFGSATLVDLTGTTATADKILSGYGAFGADGAWMDGTATASSGSGVVWQDSQGYVHLSDEGDIPLQTKTVTPSETAQTITPDNGYYALDKVNVGAISSSYVGSGITRRSSSDLTASGATVTVPSGYYSAQASKAVASGTAGTPTATKGTVSNHSVTVTPSVTNTAGYISGGTINGTAVTVSASELVSGTKSITGNGTGIDVTNYASVDVNVSGGGGGGTSNFVTGTFTGTTAGAAMNVTIPYSGSGYPILVAIEPTGGVKGNSEFFTTVQRYATAQYFLYKGFTTTTPTYAGIGNENGYIPTNVYKSSSSDYENLSRNGSTGAILANSSGTATSSSNGTLVYLHSATEMSVFIADTSYGFRANTEYTYRILYSS